MNIIKRQSFAPDTLFYFDKIKALGRFYPWKAYTTNLSELDELEELKEDHWAPNVQELHDVIRLGRYFCWLAYQNPQGNLRGDRSPELEKWWDGVHDALASAMKREHFWATLLCGAYRKVNIRWDGTRGGLLKALRYQKGGAKGYEGRGSGGRSGTGNKFRELGQELDDRVLGIGGTKSIDGIGSVRTMEVLLYLYVGQTFLARMEM